MSKKCRNYSPIQAGIAQSLARPLLSSPSLAQPWPFTASVGYRCLRAYSASNSDRASLSNDSKEPVIRQVLSPVFGFVEQVEDAQRSDRRLQTAAGGVEQIFAGCAAVQVEGGAAGMLVALRGASQGDEGGRGLCGDGFARIRCRSGKVRSASQNAKQRASASHRQHAIALNGRFDSSSCGDAVPGSSASPPTPETPCPTAFSCSSWP
ncbi:hypothetical protein PA96_4358 [Pseudomonas aeruginosa PA96]|nr:hypothetical protein PA96_4358 [Pseudomonas aeruginosa PA96]